jgi:N-acetylglutamate synthase-like GNAT family acetyltransferase
MKIRSAEPEDIETVRGLLLDAELPTGGLEDQFGASYAVAEDADGGVVGTAGVERYGRFGLLRSVAVARGARNRGVAALLVRDRMAWAGTEGLDSVYLLTTTAAEYFGRLGFEPVERDELPLEIRESPEFSGICPETSVAMRRAV